MAATLAKIINRQTRCFSGSGNSGDGVSTSTVQIKCNSGVIAPSNHQVAQCGATPCSFCQLEKSTTWPIMCKGR